MMRVIRTLFLIDALYILVYVMDAGPRSSVGEIFQMMIKKSDSFDSNEPIGEFIWADLVGLIREYETGHLSVSCGMKSVMSY